MEIVRGRIKGRIVGVGDMEELEPIVPRKPKLIRRRKRQIRLAAKKEAAAVAKKATFRLRRRKKIRVVRVGAKGTVLPMPMINAEGHVGNVGERAGKRSAVTGDLSRTHRGIGKSFIDSLTKVR